MADSMNVRELNREQKVILKEMFMISKVNEGNFGAVFNKDYDEPSWADISNADKMVSDETIYSEYEGISFVPEDFFS